MSADGYLESVNQLALADGESEWARLDHNVVVRRVLPVRASAISMAIKRAIDILGALTALVALAIPACLIAVAVKLTTRGPVLFVHERVGQGGRSISVVKFRTMRVGTEHDVLADPALRRAYEDNDFKLSANDPRITPIGRWLRCTSLDEIPQFLNVLRGEMSLVGVRPLVRRELDLRPRYERECYLRFRPGLTGLWQVEGRSTIAPVDRRRLDLAYLEDWSLRRDLQLLWRTPAAVSRVGQAR